MKHKLSLGTEVYFLSHINCLPNISETTNRKETTWKTLHTGGKIMLMRDPLNSSA